MAKKNYKLVEQVTALTDHESEMGRGGYLKFVNQVSKVSKTVIQVPIKTWDKETVTTTLALSDMKADFTTFEKLLEVEETYNRKSFKFTIDAIDIYVDWSTMIKEAMGLFGSNSYQEAKAKWAELSAQERNTYSHNAEVRLIQLLESKNKVEMKVFTTA